MTIPQPLDFLDAVTGHVDRGRTSSADRPIRLATVDPAYDPFFDYPAAIPAARVTFEGETTLSAKAYAVAGGFVPRAGQRVYLLPQGNGYLIAGSVNTQTPQGFWQEASGAESGVELGGGSYYDTTDGLYLEGDLTVTGQATMAGRPITTGRGAGLVHWAFYTASTDASGVLTITHGAGFTPDFVLVGQTGSVPGTSALHLLYVGGSATATTFQVRCFSAGGVALAAGVSIGISALLAA